jgi:hypothetical protein
MAAPVVEGWLARSLPAAFRTMVTETLQATSLREDIGTFQLPFSYREVSSSFSRSRRFP